MQQNSKNLPLKVKIHEGGLELDRRGRLVDRERGWLVVVARCSLVGGGCWWWPVAGATTTNVVDGGVRMPNIYENEGIRLDFRDNGVN